VKVAVSARAEASKRSEANNQHATIKRRSYKARMNKKKRGASVIDTNKRGGYVQRRGGEMKRG
jgi:hypothetical protein